MPVPEAPMNPNDLSPTRERYVWPTGELRVVQAVPEPEGRKESTDTPFGASILSSDPGHPLATFSVSQSVGRHLGLLATLGKSPDAEAV